MAPKIVDKEQKKRDIQRAALAVISKKGYANTKMADIASEAGIGKGTIYEYFRSKEDIFSIAFTSMFKEMERQMAERLAQAHSPVDKLASIIDVTLSSFSGEQREFAGIMMDVWAEGVRHKDDRILKIFDIQQIYAQYRLMISSILQEGIEQGQFRPVNTHMMASLMIGAMDGLMLQLIMEENVFSREDAVQIFMDGFVAGLKK